MFSNIISLFVASSVSVNGHPADPLCTNPLLPCKFVQYDKNQRGCPPTKPQRNGHCELHGVCNYDNNSIRFGCSNNKWQVQYSRYCQLNGEQVPNGYYYLSETGCVEAICEAGRVQFNDCSAGCGYWGRYLTPGWTLIDKNFQNKNQENNPKKYVTYRCNYKNSITTFSGVGCRKDGVNYEDGFIMTNNKPEQSSGINLLWACRDGTIHWLGGPGAKKAPSGAAFAGYKTEPETSFFDDYKKSTSTSAAKAPWSTSSTSSYPGYKNPANVHGHPADPTSSYAGYNKKPATAPSSYDGYKKPATSSAVMPTNHV